MSRRVDGAGEDFGDRLAALLAGIPGFENGRGLVQPGHQHRPAGFEHDGGARIGAGDRFDEPVLTVGQREVRGVGGFGLPLVDEQDDRIGPGCGFSRPLRNRAVVVVDMGERKLPANRLERRRRIENHRPILADRLLERDSAPGDDLRRAPAGGDAAVGVSADDDEFSRLGGKWQKPLVSQ